MRAAIDVLAAQPSPRVLVMGDMGEVGDQGPAFHREVGAYAAERGIDALFALGDASADAGDGVPLGGIEQHGEAPRPMSHARCSTDRRPASDPAPRFS